MGYFKKRVSAFGFALSGLAQAFKREAHLKIHVVSAIVVVFAGFYFRISSMEWVMLLICITLVITFELINSALEKLCDRLLPEQDMAVKYIKDVSAGAVLITCIFALIVALIIFIPYLL